MLQRRPRADVLAELAALINEPAPRQPHVRPEPDTCSCRVSDCGYCMKAPGPPLDNPYPTERVGFIGTTEQQ